MSPAMTLQAPATLVFGDIGQDFVLYLRQGRDKDTEVSYDLRLDADAFAEFVADGGLDLWDRAFVAFPSINGRDTVDVSTTDDGVEFHVRGGPALVTVKTSTTPTPTKKEKTMLIIDAVTAPKTCKARTPTEEGLFQVATILARALRAANQEQNDLTPLGRTPFCLLAAWSAANQVVRPKLGQGVSVQGHPDVVIAPMGPGHQRISDGRFGHALLKRTPTGWVVEGAFVPLKAKEGETRPPFFVSIDVAQTYDIAGWLAPITDGDGIPSDQMFSFWTDHIGRLDKDNINPQDVARAIRKVAKPLVRNGRRVELGGKGEEIADADWVATQIRQAIDYHLNKEGGFIAR